MSKTSLSLVTTCPIYIRLIKEKILFSFQHTFVVSYIKLNEDDIEHNHSPDLAFIYTGIKEKELIMNIIKVLRLSRELKMKT